MSAITPTAVATTTASDAILKKIFWPSFEGIASG